jgi:hypothetical protein
MRLYFSFFEKRSALKQARKGVAVGIHLILEKGNKESKPDEPRLPSNVLPVAIGPKRHRGASAVINILDMQDRFSYPHLASSRRFHLLSVNSSHHI